MLHPIRNHGQLIAIGLLLLSGSPFANAQLPDESQLPATAPPTALPDESQLPTAPTKSNELPSEAALPGVPAGDTDSERESSLSPGSLRPWLRLRFDGHTGTVRALAISDDGKYLVSAGEDKDLHIWSRQIEGGEPKNWFHRRTIRWQVERGPRGRIYAVAAKGNLIAMAGHGAMGGMGEIWVVDVATGNLVRTHVDTDNGHRQVIASLAWQPGPGIALASADVEGRVILWTPDAQTGIWSPKTIVAPDSITYGAAVAPALASRRLFVPIAFLGSDQLLMPRYVGPVAEREGEANWQIQRYHLSRNRSDLLPIDHVEMVTCMATTSDGKRLATGDTTGRVLQWVVGADPNRPLVTSVDGKRRVALSMDYSDDGKRLLVGSASATANVDSPANAFLEWFDTSDPAVTPKLLSSASQPSRAWGALIDKQANAVIATDANKVHSHPLTADQIAAAASQRLVAKVGAVRRVAFADEPSLYRIGIGTDSSADGSISFSNSFDLSAVKLEPVVAQEQGTPNARRFINPDVAKAVWDLRLEIDEAGERQYLYEGEAKRGRLPLRGEAHGLVTSAAWFDQLADPDVREDDAKPRKAVAVGTDGRNNLYVYEAGDSAEAKLLRQYRGHSGAVLSVGVSADQRYLVSGSDDATICIWKLEDVFVADELSNRWGANFEVRRDRLFALDVRRDGPLYFRGVREGDQLVNIGWVDSSGTHSAADANAILAALAQVDFDTLVFFQFSRLGRPREAFQSFPAWQPVATLFVDQSREWAFWTPAGFYDASFGGNELFGWQINRGVSTLPDYFRAAQFRQRLEQPAAMRRLLSAGDLSTAMENGISGIAPPPGEGAIVNQVLSKPVIRLLQPAGDQSVDVAEVEVVAEISVPRGAVLQPPKAFAGGVPAVNRRLVKIVDGDEQEKYVYQWTARLPNDSRVPLDVIAVTDAGAIDRVGVELENKSPPPTRQPRMHFLALGVSQYADPQIQQLDFAARGAAVMSDLFQEQTVGLYRTTTSQLLDRDAIRPLWRDYAGQAARELSNDVHPDDLVVMYLCGHGIRDRRTNRWYFVTADARYNDIMNDRYDDLLSFDDLAMLGELPCRKLAIIDSCHSGAVQPVMRSDDLKAAMRMLQGDVVVTMTASEGEEEAAEQKDRQLGRFTSLLVDALRGQGDVDGDGVVSIREAVDYVMIASAKESLTSGFVQHPTAGPADLLETLSLPLTRSK
jgi:WD40 repeat protein